MMNLNNYKEVIDFVEMTTSDGATVRVQLDDNDIGNIEVIPWTSHEDGDYCCTYQDRVIFSPANGHDVMVLEFLAKHAAERYAAIMAEEEQREQAEARGEKKSPVVISGPGATAELNGWALK